MPSQIYIYDDTEKNERENGEKRFVQWLRICHKGIYSSKSSTCARIACYFIVFMNCNTSIYLTLSLAIQNFFMGFYETWENLLLTVAIRKILSSYKMITSMWVLKIIKAYNEELQRLPHRLMNVLALSFSLNLFFVS